MPRITSRLRVINECIFGNYHVNTDLPHSSSSNQTKFWISSKSKVKFSKPYIKTRHLILFIYIIYYIQLLIVVSAKRLNWLWWCSFTQNWTTLIFQKYLSHYTYIIIIIDLICVISNWVFGNVPHSVGISYTYVYAVEWFK